jgi:hypothetical protein
VIASEGEFRESKYKDDEGVPKQDFYLDVKKDGEEYSVRCNWTNQKSIAKALGKETNKWVGATIKIEVVKVMVSGNLKDSLHFSVVAKPDSKKVDPELDKSVDEHTPEDIKWEE